MNDHDPQQGCIGEQMLSDIDLLAALDGEADAAVLAHLAECRCCASRAELLGKVQRYLRTCLGRTICPSTLSLIDYYLHLLDPAQQSAVAAHLLGCPSCNEDLTRITAVGEPVYRYVQAP